MALEALAVLLGEQVEENEEAVYGLQWPGKRGAARIALQPSALTLRLNEDASSRQEDAPNVFIKAENLEALKLLQNAYYGEVGFIYIDPPYNTGEDFIYSDRYYADKMEYATATGQVADNKANTLNRSTSGRFHSDWLSMMYPRLILARNLLSDSGLIAISIDETEFANLSVIADEIFDARNRIATLVWQNKKGGGNDSTFVAIEHEYVLIYSKQRANLDPFFVQYDDEYLKRYNEEDSEGRYYWDTFRRKSGKQYYPITAPDGTVLEFDESGKRLSWLRSEKRFHQDLEKGDVRVVRGRNGWTAQFKQRLPKGKKPRSLLTDYGTTADGSKALERLIGPARFDNPKPVELIAHLIEWATEDDDLVLDFFAGSGTTAQAVMAANRRDGGSRRWMLVQHDEAGGEPITAVTLERVKAAVESEQVPKDWAGWRVFELVESNLPRWDGGAAANSAEDLLAELEKAVTLESHSYEEADLEVELLIRAGVRLDAPLRTRVLGDDRVRVADHGRVVVCAQRSISPDLIEAVLDEYPNLEAFILQDAVFQGNDATKVNAAQLLRAPNGGGTRLKVA